MSLIDSNNMYGSQGKVKIDITKKYQTRDGKAVRLISDQGRSSYPIIGVVVDSDSLQEWTADGKYTTNGFDPELDLVPVKEKRTGWVNIYPNGSVSIIHPNKGQADSHMDATRVACAQIEWEE